ncbi:YtxH domain-containing protein [Petroclostridium sp. X23]|uniref:YtxH domain-containing protein n=1 Tax=Petroclostridium sp. X23 TaxID=3045146 RepID=UPI0024AD5ADF|nr:YtxH domain-containing protein [Petroclostridium sp. X23]WHH59678.1 YtxH domain-containing protein [Petroclostridium sp. X23]
MMRGNNFTRGLITGTIVGATVAMMMNPMEERDRKRLKRKSGHLMRSMGEVIGEVLEEVMDMRR